MELPHRNLMDFIPGQQRTASSLAHRNPMNFQVGQQTLMGAPLAHRAPINFPSPPQPALAAPLAHRTPIEFASPFNASLPSGLAHRAPMEFTSQNLNLVPTPAADKRAGISQDKQTVKSVKILFFTLKANGLYDFTATNDDELSFKAGDVLEVLEHDTNGWVKVKKGSQTGFIPGNYVEFGTNRLDFSELTCFRFKAQRSSTI